MAGDAVFWGQKSTTVYSEDDTAAAIAYVTSAAQNPYQVSQTLGVNPYHMDRLLRHRKITPTMARALAKAGVIVERVLVEVEACHHCGKAHVAKGCPSNRKKDKRKRATIDLDKPGVAAAVLRRRMAPEAFAEFVELVNGGGKDE